jgi:hypothetical protein
LIIPVIQKYLTISNRSIIIVLYKTNKDKWTGECTMSNASAIELFKQAGLPYRAVVKLSEPTRVWTGKTRSSIKTEFEAFTKLTNENVLGYFFNPKTYYLFYMPENVVEFIPVDTRELWSRARKAANHIINDRIYGRELDDAFENNDGDEMCAALWRMAQKSAKLRSKIESAWKINVQHTFVVNYDKFASLSNKELSEHARKTRENEGRKS